MKKLMYTFVVDRFAIVVVASDNSSRILFEKLPKKEIHGQVPVVTHCNRQALSQFEAQARKGEEPPQNGDGECTQYFSSQGIDSSFVYFLDKLY